MKFCIIYKYSSTRDKPLLGKELEHLSSILNELGHETFIFDRDVKNWQNVDIPREESSKMVFTAIEDCDGVIAYVNHNDLSEGMAMEAGYAKALKKKILLAVKKGTDSPRVKSISDLYVEFDDLEDLKDKLNTYLNKAFAVSQ